MNELTNSCKIDIDEKNIMVKMSLKNATYYILIK
jgi:hypothetical protein